MSNAQKIKFLKRKLNTMVEQSDNLLAEDIQKVSQELDECIVAVMQKRAKKEGLCFSEDRKTNCKI